MIVRQLTTTELEAGIDESAPGDLVQRHEVADDDDGRGDGESGGAEPERSGQEQDAGKEVALDGVRGGVAEGDGEDRDAEDDEWAPARALLR